MKKLILSILLCISLFTVGSVFAQTTQKTPSLQDTKDILTLLVYILSRVRIPVANLAGKLMTNSLVNGEVFHLAGFMYQCRQILRVIANFVLVGVILQIIYSIATSGATKDLGSKVWKILVTSILINASRWMVGAMVDLSNLAVMGVSNIGYSMISSIPGIKSNISAQMICLPKETTTDLGAEKSKKYAVAIDPEKCANKNPGEVVDTIVPTYDDMSGPFMYFGRGVFKIFEFMNVSTANSSAGAATSDNMAIVISFAVKLFLMGMFLTPLFALLIVNLVRIFLIWMWFICGPIIALKRGLQGMGIGRFDSAFGSAGRMGVLGADYGEEDYFDIKNIIGALFTPATVCATLFLAIIMISSIFGGLARPDAGLVGGLAGAQGAVGGVNLYNNLEEKRTQENYGIKIDGRTIEAEGISKVTLDGDIFSDTSGYLFGSFGYLIICVMTMGLMRAVFRVGLSTSKLLSKMGNKIMDSGKEFLTKGVQLPVGIGGAPISLDQMQDKLKLGEWEKKFNENYINPIKDENYSKAQRDFQRSSMGQALNYEINYGDRGVKFKLDNGDETAITKFPDQTAVFKTFKGDTNKRRHLQAFEFQSANFFEDLYKSVHNKNSDYSGKVVGSSNQLFRGHLKSWLEKGGASYLYYKELLPQNPEKLKEFQILDGDKVTGWNFDAIIDKSKPFGKMVESLLSSGSLAFNQTADGKGGFGDAIDGIGGGKNKDAVNDNQYGKELPKLTIKSQNKSFE